MMIEREKKKEEGKNLSHKSIFISQSKWYHARISFIFQISETPVCYFWYTVLLFLFGEDSLSGMKNIRRQIFTVDFIEKLDDIESKKK